MDDLYKDSEVELTDKTKHTLCDLKNALEDELHRIMDYWVLYAPDDKYGGFIGHVDQNNIKIQDADKGVVLNSRILWTFSAMFKRTGEKKYLDLARRAYNYMVEYFVDRTHGGVYSTVNHKGIPVSDKKQIYCQAFAMYSFSEYYLASGDASSLKQAENIFHLLEKYSWDNEHKGYVEAFSNDWSPVTDYRLSEKDENYPKTMNSHLHLLEAYTCFYKASGFATAKKALREMVTLFVNRIIQSNGHLELYFDMDWTPSGKYVSYGHDIEAAWLINEALGYLDTDLSFNPLQGRANLLAETFRKEAIDIDGGVLNELDLRSHGLSAEKHHWPQAEALVGLLDAYEITGREDYLQLCIGVFQYIQRYIIDPLNGEWFLRVDKQGSPMGDEKIGYWKCPYHNARACMEVNQRIERILEKSNAAC